MNTRIRHLNIEVTKRCNQRCFYCFNNSGLGSAASELTMERWLSILRALQLRGLDSVHLTGGEPFAYKNAVELLAGAQALNLSTSVLSNGLHVEELTSDFPNVFRKLTVAQISLDSMNEETHNLRRGYARAWSNAVTAIRALRQLSVSVEVSCVVSDTNLADLGGMAEFCQTVGAALLIRPIIPEGRAANQKLPDGFVQDLAVCVQSLREYQHLPLVSDRFHYVADERQTPAVGKPQGFHTVHHDGRLCLSDGKHVNLLSLAA